MVKRGGDGGEQPKTGSQPTSRPRDTQQNQSSAQRTTGTAQRAHQGWASQTTTTPHRTLCFGSAFLPSLARSLTLSLTFPSSQQITA